MSARVDRPVSLRAWFSDGEPVAVRADEDGVAERRGDRAGRGEVDDAVEQRRGGDAGPAGQHPLQERRLQELDQSRGAATGEPLAHPQDHLPRLRDRGARPLGDRLHVPRPISDLVRPDVRPQLEASAFFHSKGEILRRFPLCRCSKR